MKRLLISLSLLCVTADGAQAIVFALGRSGSPSRDPYSTQVCKPVGVDENGERLWQCREPIGRGNGVKPVMRCSYVARTHIKMVYCSDGTSFRVDENE